MEPAVEKSPSVLNMTDQALRLVLGCNANPAYAGVNAIGQRKIDDAEFSAKRHRRLGAPVCQLPQAAAAPASQYHRYRIARNLTVKTQVSLLFHLLIIVGMDDLLLTLRLHYCRCCVFSQRNLTHPLFCLPRHYASYPLRKL
jgi:hypothetical protein